MLSIDIREMVSYPNAEIENAIIKLAEEIEILQEEIKHLQKGKKDN